MFMCVKNDQKPRKLKHTLVSLKILEQSGTRQPQLFRRVQFPAFVLRQTAASIFLPPPYKVAREF
jgi:hypothetical protein